jgi:predicted RNA-binding protein with PUA-like domain
MSYWLLKTEPSVYSYANLERDKKATWDGVTNNLALKHIRSMKKGDLAFIYHTGDEKSIVGIAEVVSDPYPDKKAKDAKLVVVDLKPSEALAFPISLSAVKSRKEFADFALVRIGRLSVMPVTGSQWKLLLAMSGKK